MTDDSEATHRAERRKNRQRRHRRILGWGALALLVLGLGAVAFAVFVVRDDSNSKVAASEQGEARDTTSTSTDPSQVEGTPPREITVDDPLRLWIGGDSLAGSLGPSLGQVTAETGVVQPQFDSRVSSGLLNPGFFNWPKEAASEMAAVDPEVVVFIVGANDYSSAPDASNTEGVAAFKTEYEEKIDEMLDVFDTSKRTVYWVSPPVMKDDDMNDGVKVIQEATEEALAGRKNVVYIDAYPVLDDLPGDGAADHTGEYTSRLVDPETGKTVVVRAGDGIHLAPDGGDMLARAVYTPLDAQWFITEHAVPGHEKSVRQTKGSNQVPGTSRGITGNTVTPTTKPLNKTTSSTTASQSSSSEPEPAPEPEPEPPGGGTSSSSVPIGPASAGAGSASGTGH